MGSLNRENLPTSLPRGRKRSIFVLDPPTQAANFSSMDAKVRNLMCSSITKLKQVLVLWLEGFREACCLHRVVIYCLRSRELAVRTGQCFLLNGFIFLGSIFVLRSVIIPTLNWLLPDGCSFINSQELCSFGAIFRFYSFLRLGLVQLFYVFWFYPMYISSFIISTLWYNDIAKHGLSATEKRGTSGSEASGQKNLSMSESTPISDKGTDIRGAMIGLAEQVYSVLLLSFFFVEVYVIGFVPFVGKALNFLLLSWMYAYYCFEYKWNYSGLSLDKRLEFFESNWPFFAGFGSPCVLSAFFFSPLVSYGVMAILYPLFVLTATGSEADKVIASWRNKWTGVRLGRIPIFLSADFLSMKALSFFPVESPRQQEATDRKAL
ncbi:protein EI24 homolog [Andrographis paniculata]|uniref:protein EI24 homolog n=1 Tax=Andrographis paniculata TaxID=175694 RepID=UPI0021E77613|nr:protein EI24 homolog [Andrographis paniculata]